MDEDCSIVGEVERPALTSPLMKNLKQSRLPFAPLDTRAPQEAGGGTPRKPKHKKRKLSDTTPAPQASAPPSARKRRGRPPKHLQHQQKGRPGQEVKAPLGKNRKRGRMSAKGSRKAAPDKGTGSTVGKDSDQVVCSAEEEEEEEAPQAKRKSLEKTRKLLPVFLPSASASLDREEKENLVEEEEVVEEEVEQKEEEDLPMGEEQRNSKEKEATRGKEEAKVDKRKEGKSVQVKKRKTKAAGKDSGLKKQRVEEGEERATKAEEEKGSGQGSAPTRKRKKKMTKKMGKEHGEKTAEREDKGMTRNTSLTKTEVKAGDKTEGESGGTTQDDGSSEEERVKAIKEEDSVSEGDGNAVSEEDKGSSIEENEDSKEADRGDSSCREDKDDDAEGKKAPQLAEGKKSGRKSSIDSKDESSEEKEENGKITKYFSAFKRSEEEGDCSKETDKVVDAKHASQGSEDNRTRRRTSPRKAEKKGVQVEAMAEKTGAAEETTEETEADESKLKTTTPPQESPSSSKQGNETHKGEENKESERQTARRSLSTQLKTVGKKKLTPKQLEKEREREEKRKEREEQRKERERRKKEELAEKERKKKEKEEERIRNKEEKEKIKDDIRKKRQEEQEAKRQKKEEEQLRKDEERKQKEEERKQKEEERRQKEEERRQKEEEQQREKDRLKHRFASFFVAKKRDSEGPEEGNQDAFFKQFRVKEDMQLAPLHRTQLTQAEKAKLSVFLEAEVKRAGPREMYLAELKAGTRAARSSPRTWPPTLPRDDDDDDDDVEIIHEVNRTVDEEMEVEAAEEAASVVVGGLAGTVVRDLAATTLGRASDGRVRAKLLSFSDNRRPAYWGTWTKASATVHPRRPFAKDASLDYEYDSDEDWEEEEGGESLSDSEGEDKEDKEEEDQYEVDNDFFVPHGYLSDDEGHDDDSDNNTNATAGEPQEGRQGEDERKGELKNREELKQKQAEFELEMKRKTKELKPRVIGCLWLGDLNNPAYHQLLKVLNPHKVVQLCPRLPLGTSRGGHLPPAAKDQKGGEEEGPAEEKSKKFAKTFPEEAVPALIKLIHGNRNGKAFLSREFADYWRKSKQGQAEEEEEDSGEHKAGGRAVKGSSGGGGGGGPAFIAKRKVLEKMHELGSWRKCPDDGPLHSVKMWYVSAEVRERYGCVELSLPNGWTYLNTPRESRGDPPQEDPDVPDKAKLTPITAFTRKAPDTPSRTTGSSPPVPGAASPSTPTTTSKGHKRKGVTPSPRHSPGQPSSAQKASFASFFKRPGERAAPSPSTSPPKASSSKDSREPECISLD